MKNSILSVFLTVLVYLLPVGLIAQLSTTPIGSAGNVFTAIQGQNNFLVASNDLNTVLFIHRNDPFVYPGTNTAMYRYDISKDGGLTWTTDVGVLNPSADNTTVAARYPQAGIINVANDPEQSFLVYQGSYHDGDAWSGTVEGIAQLNGDTTTWSENVNPWTIPPGASVQTSFIEGRPNEFWSTNVITTLNFSNNQNLISGILVRHGVPDLVNAGMIWSDTQIPVSLVQVDSSNIATSVNIAFDPTGRYGWISFLGDATNDGIDVYEPILFQSDDFGQTWNGPIILDLPRFSNLVDEIDPNGSADITTAFDADITVDVNGNPHMVVVVGTGSPYSIEGTVKDIYDFTYDASRGNCAWQAIHLSQVQTLRGTLTTDASPLTEDNRPMTSRSPDGSKVFFFWTDSDPILTGSENTLPDLFGIGVDVLGGTKTTVKNFTSNNGQWTQKAYFPMVAEECLVSASTFTIPTVLTELDYINGQGSGEQPARFHYASNIQFSNSEFTFPAFTPSYTWRSQISACPNSIAFLNPDPICTFGNYTYSWTPTIGLSSPNSLNTNVSINGSQVYTLEIFDSGLLVYTNTVEINMVNCNTSCGIDTLTDPLDRSTALSIYRVSGGGFVFGANSFNSTQVGMRYDFAGTAIVRGFQPWVGSKQVIGSADSLRAFLYDADQNGLPNGAPLATKTISVDDLDTSGIGSVIRFDNAVLVQNDYIIALEVDGPNIDDTISIVNSVQGDGLNEEKSVIFFGGTWFTSGQIWSIGGEPLDVEVMLFPEIELLGGIESSGGRTVCPESSVQLNTTILCAEAPYTYQWSPTIGLSNPNIANPIASPAQSTTYTVLVTDNRGNTFTDSEQVDVLSGCGERLILLEEFVGTETIGAIYNPRFDSLVRTISEKVAVIKYHAPFFGSNPFHAFNTSDNDARQALYNISGYPAIKIDGIVDAHPANISEQDIDNRLSNPPLADITLDQVINGNRVDLLATVNPLVSVIPNNTLLHVVVIEDSVALDTPLSNGEQIFMQPMRYMLPNASGTQIQAPFSSTFQIPLSVTLDSSLQRDQISFVAFLQDENSLEVYQAVRFELEGRQSLDVEVLPADTAVCARRPVNLNTSITNGTPPYSYSWSPGQGLSDQTSATPTATVGSTSILTVTVTDATGITGTASATINVSTLQVLIAPSLPCAPTATLAASPASMVAYQWNTGATTPDITVSQSGDYYLFGLDNIGCLVNSDTVSVSINPEPMPTISEAGGQLCTESFDSYQWFFNGNFLNGANQQCYTPVFTGFYSVQVINEFNCEAETEPFFFDPTAPACDMPASISTTGAQPNRATLNWDAVNGASCYEIRGNRLGANGFVELNIPNGTQTTLSPGGLQPGASYFWQIRACCDVDKTDCSAWTAIDTFSTSCPAPSPISITNITNQSARINWSTVAGATGYEVRGRQLGGNWVVVPRNGPSANGLNTGNILSPSTSYEVQVRALCSGVDRRNSAYTSLTQFTTASSKEGDLLSDQVSFSLVPNPNNGQFSLVWNAFEAFKGEIRVYDQISNLVFNELTEIEPAQKHSIDLNGVASGIYFVEVASENIRVRQKVVIR